MFEHNLNVNRTHKVLLFTNHFDLEINTVKFYESEWQLSSV